MLCYNQDVPVSIIVLLRLIQSIHVFMINTGAGVVSAVVAVVVVVAVVGIDAVGFIRLYRWGQQKLLEDVLVPLQSLHVRKNRRMRHILPLTVDNPMIHGSLETM